MAIDFPNSPSLNQTFTVGAVTWKWDGSTWKSTSLEEAQHLLGVTSNIQTQLDGKAPSASPTFTGTVVLPSTTSIGNVTSTELAYLDGVTSSIQTQINNISPDPMPQVLMMMGA